MSEQPLPSIAVLLVCRNRRHLTLRAMRALAANPVFGVNVVLFDDASSDGTVDAVLSEFPDTIVIQGDGTSFWNGGLHRAWKRALDLPVEGFLWLNDDVRLDADAMSRLADAWMLLNSEVPRKPFILVGATRGSDGCLTYGGMLRIHSPLVLRLSTLSPVDALTPIHTFNGNIVLVPRDVVDRIGINDPGYFHAFGDIDYGLTATAAGVRAFVMPGTLGVCERNQSKGFGGPGLGLVERWKRANSHFGLPMASQWRLARKHSGIWFLFHFIAPYRSLLRFPILTSKRKTP